MTPPPLLEASALAMWRGERCLFRDLSLALRAGRALHVRGPNGSGKTTLLRILCGLLAPDGGELKVDGHRVRGADARLRSAVAYLGHADGLKLELRVAENLRFAAAVSGTALAGGERTILERMGIDGVAGLETRLLSAGQRRRLAVGRVLASGARIWVLDEPFTSLDADGVSLLGRLMHGALEGGTAIVFSSHQAATLDRARVDVLELQEGTP